MRILARQSTLIHDAMKASDRFRGSLSVRSSNVEEVMGLIRRFQASAKRVIRTSWGGQPELSTEEPPVAWLAGSDRRDDERLINRRIRSKTKFLVRSVVRTPRDRRSVVFIFGCQRSGTTMVQQTLLDRSWRVLIMEEH